MILIHTRTNNTPKIYINVITSHFKLKTETMFSNDEDNFVKKK